MTEVFKYFRCIKISIKICYFFKQCKSMSVYELINIKAILAVIF